MVKNSLYIIYIVIQSKKTMDKTTSVNTYKNNLEDIYKGTI